MVRCNMGVGCDEYGVCYAEAHGQPDRCERPQSCDCGAVFIRKTATYKPVVPCHLHAPDCASLAPIKARRGEPACGLDGEATRAGLAPNSIGKVD